MGSGFPLDRPLECDRTRWKRRQVGESDGRRRGGTIRSSVDERRSSGAVASSINRRATRQPEGRRDSEWWKRPGSGESSRRIEGGGRRVDGAGSQSSVKNRARERGGKRTLERVIG